MNRLADGLKRFLYGLCYLIVIGFTVAIVAYILVTYFGKIGEPPGFELATVSALIGGFILTSAFFGKASSGLRLKLRRIGVSFLVATLAFVVFAICFPLIDKLPQELVFCNVNLLVNPTVITVWVTGISIGVGAASFAEGAVQLALVIPQLWRKSYSELT